MVRVLFVLMLMVGCSSKKIYLNTKYPAEKIQAYYDQDFAMCKDGGASLGFVSYGDPYTVAVTSGLFAVASMVNAASAESATRKCMEELGWKEAPKGRAQLWTKLDKLKPGWRETDSNTYFLHWLDRTQHRAKYMEAVADGDAQMCVDIMNEWEKRRSAYWADLDRMKPDWRGVDQTSQFWEWLNQFGKQKIYLEHVYCLDALGIAQDMDAWQQKQ
ncbi:MAG: hypothetical protein JEY79_00835 [Pseudodesulfovibrio sp.]|nr:hypothetical protein [Pseudodesulfovibrio sp.]